MGAGNEKESEGCVTQKTEHTVDYGMAQGNMQGTIANETAEPQVPMVVRSKSNYPGPYQIRRKSIHRKRA